ncbi:DUF1810 domain-containing protein [Meridianimarinicoccus roseus]|uniref:DUF1810 domain-containing protein n=1 Tax=Meridianimarinicoccus roseus TaxID=2072018 RepID=A0A2V2LH22_9RHOB|nr:DUF1810 domain-containing protein [Meridianimarinicoccus roseus]PWR02546.1 DUF1810 domain-containing protein [Meridianimarinicoccus roseus]
MSDLSFGHFVIAQEACWSEVLAELRAGRKTSHWMWFVFPQHVELGRSATARRFGLAGRAEARAYAADPVVGVRLRAALDAAMQSGERDPVRVFGHVDAMKLRSCLTLFAACADDPAPFRAGLTHFFGGEDDPATRDLLARAPGVSG